MADLINQLQAAAGAGKETDPNFANTVLLLHGDGTNGAQNNTFIDSSTNNFTITRNGNTTQGAFTPFSKPDGRWGNFFDGDNDNLSNIGSVSDFNFIHNTTGLCTIECWVYWTGAVGTNDYILANCRNSTEVGVQLLYNQAVGKWLFRIANGTISNFVVAANSSAGVVANQWVHLCVEWDYVSDSGTWYINGAVDSTFSRINTAVNSNATDSLYIGRNRTDTNLMWQGYISNLRISNSIVYGGAFTPSTTPLTTTSQSATNVELLTCQSNRFIDNSSNAFTITRTGVIATPFSPFPITTAYNPAVNGGAGYFDGNGDYLTLPANSVFALGTADSCVEMWVYSTAMTNFRTLFMGRTTVNSGDNLAHQNNDGTINWYQSGITATAPAGSLVPYSWNHLAFVVRSGLRYIYVNGVQKIASPPSAQNVTSQNFTIGATTTPSEYYSGYMTSVRVVKGSSVYSANFTPPTSPLTDITNTSLLCNFTNAGIFDNTGFNALETVGDAQIDTTVKKYGTGSMEFDGTGDELKTTFLDSVLGSGDFTIEFWVNPGSISTGTVIDLRSDGAGFDIYFGSNILNVSTSGTYFMGTSGVTFSTSTWFHIAMVRFGSGSNNWKIYVDGTSRAQTTNTTNFTAKILRIGGGSNGALNGYIDDLRITKGIARYTTTFTPPTKSFPDIGE